MKTKHVKLLPSEVLKTAVNPSCHCGACFGCMARSELMRRASEATRHYTAQALNRWFARGLLPRRIEKL